MKNILYEHISVKKFLIEIMRALLAALFILFGAAFLVALIAVLACELIMLMGLGILAIPLIIILLLVFFLT